MLENKPGADWHSKRRLGIGSSEIGVIAGLTSSDYVSKTPFDVAYSKLYGEQDSDTSALYAGRYLERAVLDWAEDQIGERISRNRETRAIQLNGLLGLATVDGLVGNRLIVEAKTARAQTSSWGDGDHAIPELYLAQVQWQMGILGIHQSIVPTLFKAQDRFVMYSVDFDDAFFKMLVSAAEIFWSGTVAIGRLPSPGDEPDRVRNYLQAQFPAPKSKDVRLASSAEYELMRDAVRINAEIKSLKHEYELMRCEIESKIGDGYGFELDGFRAVWAKSSQRSKTDWRKVAEDLAGGDGKRLEASALKYTSTYNGSRALRITEKGVENE